MANTSTSTNSIGVSYRFTDDYDNLKEGFYQASNPAAYKRLLSIATLNAARTMVKPIRDEAPVGTTTRTPGRLRKAVAARRARWNNPAAVVGPKAGGSREDQRGAWYRWFVVSGVRGVRQTKNGTVQVKPIPARPFVARVTGREQNRARAMEALAATVEKFLNDGPFRRTILRYKRRRF